MSPNSLMGATDAPISGIAAKPDAVPAPSRGCSSRRGRRLRLKHYSLRTEQVYLPWMRRFIRANGMRHPRELGGSALEAFLTDLATRGQVAASTQNQALSALLFLYREVLAIELPWMENVVRAKGSRRLPVVLSQGRGRRCCCATVRPGLADGQPALWQRHAPDGMPAPAGEGRRLSRATKSPCARARAARIGARCCRRRCGTRCSEQIDACASLHAEDLAAGFGAVSLPLCAGAQISGRAAGTSAGNTCSRRSSVRSIRATATEAPSPR